MNAAKILADPDQLDKLIIWKMNDPNVRRARAKGETMTQRQWTIEARADFEDPGKNEAVTEAIRTAAQHVFAVLALLSDRQKPQVVCFSDDFVDGHEDIALHVQQHGDPLANAQAETQVGGDNAVSSEMLQAALEMQHDANERK